MKEEKIDLEALKKLALIRKRMRCKHGLQADLCSLCQGKTESGETIDEVIDGLEKDGFLKKIRSARKIGRIVGKTAFWAGKAMIAGGVSYIIFLSGRKILAYFERKKKNEKK